MDNCASQVHGLHDHLFSYEILNQTLIHTRSHAAIMCTGVHNVLILFLDNTKHAYATKPLSLSLSLSLTHTH
jgi:hypothetical protein